MEARLWIGEVVGGCPEEEEEECMGVEEEVGVCDRDPGPPG